MNAIKVTRWALALTLSLTLVYPAQAQMTITEKTQHSAFKGLFLTVWARLKAIQPSQRQMARSSTVATAGIRGAESTESLLQPYWKNDLSQDKAFQKQIQQFASAQDHMDKGELKQAAEGFARFINDFSSSDLVASALLSKGLCEAALGDTGAAKTSIQSFVDDNPGHPLVDEARQVLLQINS